MGYLVVFVLGEVNSQRPLLISTRIYPIIPAYLYAVIISFWLNRGGLLIPDKTQEGGVQFNPKPSPVQAESTQLKPKTKS